MCDVCGARAGAWEEQHFGEKQARDLPLPSKPSAPGWRPCLGGTVTWAPTLGRDGHRWGPVGGRQAVGQPLPLVPLPSVLCSVPTPAPASPLVSPQECTPGTRDTAREAGFRLELLWTHACITWKIKQVCFPLKISEENRTGRGLRRTLIVSWGPGDSAEQRLSHRTPAEPLPRAPGR